MNVRAKVCTKVGAMVRKWLGNYRRSPRPVRAVSGVASAQYPVKHPGNSRAVSGRLTGNVSRNAVNVRTNSHESSHNGSKMTWPPLVKSTPQITKQTGCVHEAVRVVSGLASRQHPMNHPENFRAISGSVGNSHETRSGPGISKAIPQSFHSREFANYEVALKVQQ